MSSPNLRERPKVSTLNVIIHNREYAIACDDGQEEHLKALSGEIDKRVAGLSRRMGGRAPDSLLLVLASLMLLDELSDARKEISALRESAQNAPTRFTGAEGEMENAISLTLDEVASRIERLADGITA